MEPIVGAENRTDDLLRKALASIINNEYKALTETNHSIGNDLETSDLL